MKKTYISLLLILSLLVGMLPNTSYALSDEKGSDPSGQSQRYIIENTPWYDPTACVGGSGGNGSSAATTNPSFNGKVYFIGDSITANVEYVQPNIKKLLTDRGFSGVVFNSLSSRKLSQGGLDIDGVTIFEDDVNSWKDANTIIIELGTNGGVEKGNIEAMMGLIKAYNPGAKVYWVNVGADNAKRSAQKNSTINTDSIDKTLLDNKGLGYEVIDWNTVVKNNPNYILDDGVDVHPFTTEGGKAYAETIAKGLGELTTNTAAIGGRCECAAITGESSIILSGSNNEEKVWKYLTNVGYTKAQVAGIMGNMAMESGINPRRVQGTPTPSGDRDFPPSGSIGYGLVQWTPGTKILPYADITNKSPSDLGFQLRLLVAQLKGDATTGISEGEAGKDLAAAKTPEEAARSFMLKYERPADQSEEKQRIRAERARAYFEQFAGAEGSLSGGSSNACDTTDATGGSVKIVDIAEREYLAGANEADGSYKKYTDNVNSPNGWCDYFASWVMREAGVPFTGGYGAKGYSVRPVPMIAQYFQKNGRFHEARSGYVPRLGDVVIFDYGQDGKLDHVSIVVDIDGEKITTIGGNESNKVQKAVYNSYDAKQIYGFGTQGAQ